MSRLELDEIIWELTPYCNKGCKYCGSYHVLRHIEDSQVQRKTFATFAKEISRKIASYLHHGSVNLSGGEPGVLLREFGRDFVEIVSNLKSANNRVKVITNGDFLRVFEEGRAGSESDLEQYLPRGDLDVLWGWIDSVGLSINDERDLSVIAEYGLWLNKDKVTIITNFGTHNIFLFDKIMNFVSEGGYTWQIQLTMGDYKLPGEGVEYLLSKDLPEGTVLGDNLMVQPCSAGFKTCGITFDGKVINCLAERTFGNEIVPQGDLSRASLKDIWEGSFRTCRFGDFHSCKDCLALDMQQIQDRVEVLKSDQAYHTLLMLVLSGGEISEATVMGKFRLLTPEKSEELAEYLIPFARIEESEYTYYPEAMVRAEAILSIIEEATGRDLRGEDHRTPRIPTPNQGTTHGNYNPIYDRDYQPDGPMPSWRPNRSGTDQILVYGVISPRVTSGLTPSSATFFSRSSIPESLDEAMGATDSESST